MTWRQTGVAAGLLAFGLMLGVGAAVLGRWEPVWMAAVAVWLGAREARTAWADWMEWRAPGLPGGCHCRRCQPDLHKEP